MNQNVLKSGVGLMEGRLRVSTYKVEFPFESLLVYFILRITE